MLLTGSWQVNLGCHGNEASGFAAFSQMGSGMSASVRQARVSVARARQAGGAVLSVVVLCPLL